MALRSTQDVCVSLRALFSLIIAVAMAAIVAQSVHRESGLPFSGSRTGTNAQTEQGSTTAGDTCLHDGSIASACVNPAPSWSWSVHAQARRVFPPDVTVEAVSMRRCTHIIGTSVHAANIPLLI